MKVTCCILGKEKRVFCKKRCCMKRYYMEFNSKNRWSISKEGSKTVLTVELFTFGNELNSREESSLSWNGIT